MKTRLLGLCVATILFGCTSSAPSRPGTGVGGNGSTGAAGNNSTGAAGSGSTGAGGNGSTGAAGSNTGAAGSSTGAAGDASGGAGSTGAAGASGGATGAAGSTGAAGATGGASGTAGAGGATGGTGGSTGAAGSGGATGGGAGGSTVPGTYTGQPFGGMPQSIPGTIQIENYDTGGANVAYKASGTGHGSLCGFTRPDLIDLQCTGQAGSPKDQTQGTCAALTGDVYLGYIGTGDWLNYTVNVKQAGTYAISTHVGVAGMTKLMFTFTPTVKTAALALMGTSGCGVESYHVWATENIGTIDLQPGTYVMRLDFVAAGLNIDWVAFTKM
jgi:hypothetical protein